jgi:hypothetical protein
MDRFVAQRLRLRNMAARMPEATRCQGFGGIAAIVERTAGCISLAVLSWNCDERFNP